MSSNFELIGLNCLILKIFAKKPPQVYMIDGDDIVGFKFELSENPWKEYKVPDGFKIKPGYDMKR